MPWSFGSEWSANRTAFMDGHWWFDASDNTFGYRFGDTEQEWGDTTWEFPGPDQYPTIAAEQSPGWTAKAGEKAMHEALVMGDPYAVDLAAGEHPQYRETADTLAGLMSLNTRRSWAGELLDRAVASGYEPRDDPFVRTYLPGAGIVVPIAPGVVVPLPLMRTAVALAAAELHQAAEEYERAIAVLVQVERTTHVDPVACRAAVCGRPLRQGRRNHRRCRQRRRRLRPHPRLPGIGARRARRYRGSRRGPRRRVRARPTV